MLAKSIVRSGVLLGIITILLFLSLYFVFSNSGFTSFTNRDYLLSSAFIISFVLPILYTGFAFKEVYTGAKEGVLTFRQAFRLAFLTQLVGGFLSATFIFIFLNTIGSWAEQALEDAMIESFKQNATKGEESSELLKAIEGKDVNLFSLGNYFQFLPTIIFFYLLISTILALFIKNRRV